MSVLCSECENKVYNPGAGVIRAELTKKVVKEGLGRVICHSHFDKIKDKIKPLEDLVDGTIFVIDERGGYVHRSGLAAPVGTLSHFEPTTRTKIFGYLSMKEARQYFPNTYKRIMGALSN